MNKPIVVTCIDHNLYRNVGPVYKSIKEYCNDFELYVLCDTSVPRHKMTYAEEFAHVVYDVDIPEIDCRKLKGRSRIRSKSMFFRFIAPYLINSGRIIYTDMDVIFNADITELWEMDLGNNLLAAVRDQLKVPTRHHFFLQCNNNLFPKIGDKFPFIYGSGILVIDCEKWRAEGMRNKMLTIWADNPMLDMLLMNITCYGRIKELDGEWCVPVNYLRGNTCINTGKVYDNPKCYHWHGRKPWGINSEKVNKHEIYQQYFTEGV